MNPRLKSSKKWTSFPKEYSDQIQTVFKENFAQDLDSEDLLVEGRIYSEEVVLRVGIHKSDRLAQANFDVSMNYSQSEQDAISRIHNCVDVVASMMTEYFEQEGEVDFPYTWKEFTFQGKKVFLKFSSENSSLEAEANRLLGLDPEGLIQEEDESEDALAIAEQSEELSPPRDEDSDLDSDEDLDLEDDEDEDNKGPRMFSGKSGKKIH